MLDCSRCGKETPMTDIEACWYCNRAICGFCWANYGQCGHVKVRIINKLFNTWPRTKNILRMYFMKGFHSDFFND